MMQMNLKSTTLNEGIQAGYKIALTRNDQKRQIYWVKNQIYDCREKGEEQGLTENMPKGRLKKIKIFQN